MIDRDNIIAKIRSLRPMLERQHIARVAIYGSVARGEQEEGSDLDMLIDFTDDAPKIGLIEFAGLQNQLSAALDVQVDLGMVKAMRKQSQQHILNEMIDVW